MYSFHNGINELFSEENELPLNCLKLERWQGPPHINKVKQYEIVLSLYFIILFLRLNELNKPSVNEDLSLLINMTSPKLRSAPFKE